MSDVKWRVYRERPGVWVSYRDYENDKLTTFYAHTSWTTAILHALGQALPREDDHTVSTEPIAKGQQYEVPDMSCHITVKRVARDQSWADIVVTPWGSVAGWSKRQPLGLDGRFTFVTERV